MRVGASQFFVAWKEERLLPKEACRTNLVVEGHVEVV